MKMEATLPETLKMKTQKNESNLLILIYRIIFLKNINIYLFIMYTVLCLHVSLQARRGHQISL